MGKVDCDAESKFKSHIILLKKLINMFILNSVYIIFFKMFYLTEITFYSLIDKKIKLLFSKLFFNLFYFLYFFIVELIINV